MKTACRLTDKELIFSVKRNYGIEVAALEFLPVGENSWVYIGHTVQGTRTLVKVQTQVSSAAAHVLRHLKEFDYASMPEVFLNGDGEVWSGCNAFFISVQEYIEPEVIRTADSKSDDQILCKLGEALRRLHSLDAVRGLREIPRDSFASSFARTAREAIDSVKTIKADGSVMDRVQSVIERQAWKIEEVFENERILGAALRKEERPLCLTHGDVHFGNILCSSDHPISLIDWEWSMISLPAYDFMYFDDNQLAAISEGYGKPLEDRLAIQYYRNHLMLRAFWFFLTGARHAHADEDKEAALKTFLDIIDDSPYLLRALA
jgi:aminoglycoside phosphotransferase (APT) family kinase protein